MTYTINDLINEIESEKLVEALMTDGTTFEDIERRIEFSRNTLLAIASKYPNVWDCLCDRDDGHTLFEAVETLNKELFRISQEQKKRFLDTPSKQVNQQVNQQRGQIHRVMSWKTRLKNSFRLATYTTLTATSVLLTAWLGVSSLSQVRPDIPQLETANNYSKGLALASTSLFLMSVIGQTVSTKLVVSEEKAKHG